MVLISTVGYGDFAPETSFGRVAAVVISLAGIPLLLSFYLPLSRWIVDRLTGYVRRMYISRAVERAMEAVQLTTTSSTSEESVARVDYSRRVPDASGIGLTHQDVLRVESLSLFSILCLLLVAILGTAPLLMTFQSWSLGDSLCFIWYTLTTIGLGDVTVEPRHPLVASMVLLLLLLIGASSCRALVCSVQRAAAFLEEYLSGDATAPATQCSEFTETLDRLANARTSQNGPAAELVRY